MFRSWTGCTESHLPISNNLQKNLAKKRNYCKCPDHDNKTFRPLFDAPLQNFKIIILPSLFTLFRFVFFIIIISIIIINEEPVESYV